MIDSNDDVMPAPTLNVGDSVVVCCDDEQDAPIWDAVITRQVTDHTYSVAIDWNSQRPSPARPTWKRPR